MKATTNTNETRTLEDLIFENRNKAYGAYALNRNCTKYLLIAFLISLIGVSTTVAVPFFKSIKNPGMNRIPNHAVNAIIGEVDVDPVIPPPPPPALPHNTIEQAHYSAPELVDEPAEGPDMPTVEVAIETTYNDPLPLDFPTVVPQPREIDEPDNGEYLLPEEQATFMNGDLDEFRIWVQKNIVYPELAIQHGIIGKVIVGFCINSTGQVVDVQIVRGVDASIDGETIRVISSSPLWRAARQGGVPVKQKFVIPVIFLLNECQ